MTWTGLWGLGTYLSDVNDLMQCVQHLEDWVWDLSYSSWRDAQSCFSRWVWSLGSSHHAVYGGAATATLNKVEWFGSRTVPFWHLSQYHCWRRHCVRRWVARAQTWIPTALHWKFQFTFHIIPYFYIFKELQLYSVTKFNYSILFFEAKLYLAQNNRYIKASLTTELLLPKFYYINNYMLIHFLNILEWIMRIIHKDKRKKLKFYQSYDIAQNTIHFSSIYNKWVPASCTDR